MLIHAGYDAMLPGYYRVVARDYWGRTSAIPEPATAGLLLLIAAARTRRRAA